MKTPPAAGSFFRIGIALLMCAACFQAGRSYQELTASAADGPAPETGPGFVDASFTGPTLPAPAGVPSATAAPGDPMGESGDIITPLNVRDPSALVMGPGDYHRKCPQLDPPEPEPEGRLAQPLPYTPPQYTPPKPKKMKEGRLLELLKKEDKKSVYPRRY